jgi:hypothetical protein
MPCALAGCFRATTLADNFRYPATVRRLVPASAATESLVDCRNENLRASLTHQLMLQDTGGLRAFGFFDEWNVRIHQR